MTPPILHLDSEVAPAWRALQESLPVRLVPPRTRAHYKDLVSLMNALLDEVGDDESHPSIELLDVVGQLVSSYEDEHVVVDDADPAVVLRYLMEEHGLTQADLKAELGSQSVASEILSGRRSINVRQAKALGKRFQVAPGVFI